MSFNFTWKGNRIFCSIFVPGIMSYHTKECILSPVRDEIPRFNGTNYMCDLAYFHTRNVNAVFLLHSHIEIFPTSCQFQFQFQFHFDILKWEVPFLFDIFSL